MRFTKMHGIGNDFVVLDAVADPWIMQLDELPGLARAMCRRHDAVGADGMITVQRDADSFRMRIYNADGSDGGMCGNGVRCIAKLLYERRHAKPDANGHIALRLGERELLLHIEIDRADRVSRVSVDMGKPVTDASALPIYRDRLGDLAGRAHFVGMGNPHMVLFLSAEQLTRVNPAHDGYPLEHHAAFPERMNIQFATIETRQRVRVRTWERGAGATLGCGSGACAVVAAGVTSGQLERRCTVAMPGGELVIDWDQSSNHIFMTGPAAEAYTGEWPTPVDVDRMSREGPVLRTSRLILRRHLMSDADAIFNTVSRFEVARYTLTMPHPYPRGAEIQFMERFSRGVVEGVSDIFAVTLADTGEVIGGLGYKVDPHYKKMVEIGYHMNVDHWGRGYTTEAVKALVEYCFATCGFEKIYARWYHSNLGSGRVLEKAGFKKEGLLRRHVSRFDECFDVHCESLLKSEWEAMRGR